MRGCSSLQKSCSIYAVIFTFGLTVGFILNGSTKDTHHCVTDITAGSGRDWRCFCVVVFDSKNGCRKILKIPTDSYESPLYACTIYFVVKRKGEELFRRVGDVTNYGRQWYNIKECRPIVLHCSWSCPLICEGSLACPRRRYYMNAHIISLAISPHFTLNLTTGMNRASKNMWDRVFKFFKSAKYYINWTLLC